MNRRQFNQLGVGLAIAGAMPDAFGQPQEAAAKYPSHPIRLVIPFAPGGGTDIIGRSVGQKLSEAWKQSVVPENRPGANSTIGLALVAKAPADGYSLTMITASATVNVTLQGHQLPYDLFRDFAPITQITAQPYLLVVNPALPVKTVADLIALAKRRSKPMTYGSSGIGGLSHLSGALFSSLAKIPLTHVPYKGGSPAMTAVVSGEIDMLFSTRLQANNLIEAGRLRPIAVSTAKRSAASPQLPTMSEAGVPGFEVTDWYGMLAPAGTPAPIINKLNHEIVHILKLPDIAARMRVDGSDPVGSTPSQFAAHIHTQVEKWRKLITQLGIHT
ncbi:tripartite tricarboxylate transporter substrate binding protein [Paralcaligenes sp. KSB-10]|uniref:tripartite tricarboxylate transporter substrate binding protein n=1 Tax=Paralcaligenes sp. KSB-10 TaxID=2901142 RepID=UPI001E58AB3F|nr:tripartite tricarboxylate transporter substrate binding protein [Paralcaligenes sp. KSB-10]UHL63857.1 tripartite tricarboxylate transporter substrate binding protein [Paralcaligenes sp. KSB-10]